MKSKLIFFITTLFISFLSVSGNAQSTIQKGKVQLIEFTNSTAKFKVPEGKTWYIYDVFTSSDISIRMKSLNGTELTNLSTQILGPSFQKLDIIKIFPYDTSFELIIALWSRDQNKYILSENKAWINYIEVDN